MVAVNSRKDPSPNPSCTNVTVHTSWPRAAYDGVQRPEPLRRIWTSVAQVVRKLCVRTGYKLWGRVVHSAFCNARLK